MERKEAIRSAYRLTGGNNFYDGMITCSTLSGKAVCHLVWDRIRRNAMLIWKMRCPVSRNISPANCWRCRWEPEF